MIVYVLIAWIWTGNGPVATVIDNIASRAECERLGDALGAWSETGAAGTRAPAHCFAVRKVNP